MSDRRLVTIDPGQLEGLKTRLDAISAALSPLASGLDIYQSLSHIERTLFDGFKLIAQRGGGDNSQVLTAINNLIGKVDRFMATQEERLQGIQTALTGVADGVNTLQQQITDLKAANPALDDEISAIESTVKGIADDINGVVTEPPAQG